MFRSVDVCSFRLDFETFTLAGTGNTVERQPIDAALGVAADAPHRCLDEFVASVRQ